MFYKAFMAFPFFSGFHFLVLNGEPRRSTIPARIPLLRGSTLCIPTLPYWGGKGKA
jgi:hypothetical protein